MKNPRMMREVLLMAVCTGYATACVGSSSEEIAREDAASEEAALKDFTPSLSARELRRFVDHQVGGIAKLQVPAQNSELPQPRLEDGSPDPRFETTEAKRYLGKQLYFDPIRTARIKPEFGGVLATKQSGSCGSCHLGEAAGKAGTRINFGVGGEGRGYSDAAGNFTARRRPRSELPQLRAEPLFEGDALVDALPTLTDVYEFAIGNPGRGRRTELPPAGMLLRTGQLDALDSVARNAPSMIGFAFNNRLLLGGLAGEPDSSLGALNPFGFSAQESLTQLTLDAHRMQDEQAAALQNIDSYRALFREAFPEEAAKADSGDINLLINDQTVLRAMATFLRTVVTRNTPWDHFLGGHDAALTSAQRRGAKLFFTPATEGGAGCYSCHSGPQLNKQPTDPDVTGTGAFVEENFYNVGIGNHPVQALNASVRNDPNFRDDGRREITFRDEDAFKFRVLTLRQLRDGKFFFHNGSFTSVKDAVEYFNAGVPQDVLAGAAATLAPRFTNPRGAGAPPGLGLSEQKVDDLSEFLENALYDPALVHFDPNSSTETFEPNERDLSYSLYRPDLADLKAVDGRMASGRPHSNDDALSRRDMGLEFLDVTAELDSVRVESKSSSGGLEEHVYRITNKSASNVDTHLLIVARGLADQIRMKNASGSTSAGDPYRRVFLRDGVLLPGQSITERLFFTRRFRAPRASYTLTFLSGQGNP